jgi:hypothetical protein
VAEAPTLPASQRAFDRRQIVAEIAAHTRTGDHDLPHGLRLME